MVDAAADPLVGAVLQGRYQVLARVAAGGIGVVYRGERIQLGRPVAIKFLHAWSAADKDILRRFEIEAQAMSRLAHPSCVSVIDFGVHEDAPYLVMELATGPTLRDVLDRGALDVAQALQACGQLLAGLAHAHAQGIVHRDVKPANIILTESTGFAAQVRILDFGMAKLRDTSTGMTAGLAVGTPSYMSPEQASGQAVDGRSDVYAAGVVLFEMLTGRKPFVAENGFEVLRMQREVAAPRLAAAAPGRRFSAALEAAVARALAKAPAARFQSAREFAEALERTPEAGGRPVAGAVPAGTPTRRAAWLAAGVLVVAGAGALAFRGGPPAPPPSAATALPRTAPRIDAARPRGDAPTARPSATVADARAMLQAGRWSAAIDLLRKLRKQRPDDASVPYLLGIAYLDKLWADDGFEALRAALRMNPGYRSDPAVIRSVIRIFVSDTNAGRAIAFLRDEIGAPAIPHLEETRKSRNLNIRYRAESALAQIQKASR